MTINTSTVTSGPYAGNGVADTFAYTFKITKKSDLEVYETDSNNVTTLLNQGAYSVTGIGSSSGGNITRLAGPLPSGSAWYIRSNRDRLQLTSFESQGAFFPELHEEALDQLTVLVQQLYDLNSRSIRMTEFDAGNTINEIPNIAGRANKVLGFDADGEPRAVQTLGVWRGDWSTGVSYSLYDIFRVSGTGNIYIVLDDHVSTNISADIAAGDIVLVVDVSAVTTSETNAAASASAAATSETNAATSETNAATSETNAAASASAAATSETNAAVSYDAFDDRYLGSKAADPTLDNDGDALLTGALYWSTSENKLKVYNGGSWQVTTASAAALDVTFDDTVAGIGETNVQKAIEYVAQPRKNIVLNGDFLVWPEGTSFTAPASGECTAAQWVWGQSGAGVVDVAQITASSPTASLPTVAEAGRLITSALQVDVTTADATIAAGDQYSMSTRIEGYNYAQIAQRPMVVSFWHNHTKTGTYCVSVRNAGNDRSYVAEYTQSVADTWERAEIPITASPSAGTWDYTTGVGLRLDFTIAAGSNFHTTADTWQTGDYLATSSQVNGMDAATNFFHIAGVQLEAGTVATEFEQLHYSSVLAATKRYYRRVNGVGINGFAQNATTVRAGLRYEVEMRAAPTATLLDTTPQILYGAAAQNGVSSTIAGTVVSSQGIRLAIDGFTGLTIGEGIVFNEDTDLLALDARL